MKKLLLIIALTAILASLAEAQQTSDPRVADFVQASNGLGESRGRERVRVACNDNRCSAGLNILAEVRLGHGV
jgi:hypothetical protein